MSPEEAAFIRAISADPENDLPRLVLADWLEEQGRINQAECIRLQCEYARLRCGSKEQSQLDATIVRRIRELRETCTSEWVQQLNLPSSRMTMYRLRRGLISKLWCTAKFFLEYGASVQNVAPLTTVTFRRFVSKNASQIAACPAFDTIRELDFLVDETPAHVVVDGLRRLDLSRLTALHCSSSVFDRTNPNYLSRNSSIAETIAAIPSLSNLRQLHLRMTGIGDAGGLALVRSPHLAKLDLLQVDENGLSDRVVSALRQRFGKAAITSREDHKRFTLAQLGWDT